MKTLFLLTLFLLCLVIAISAKPVLEIKQLNSFSVSELPIDQSLILHCITDSLIIFYVLPDSAEAKAVCYDYQGNRMNVFNVPEVIKYRRPFNINYLFGRKQLAVSIPGGIDFLSIEGDSLGHIDILDDQTWLSPASLYLSCAEYDSLLYFRFYRAMEAAYIDFNILTSSFTWLQEMQDGEMLPLRKMFIDRDMINLSNAFPYPNFGFLFGTNRDKQMAYVEEKKDKYSVSFYADNLRQDFTIKRRKNDHLNFMDTGENYVVIYTVDPDKKLTKTTGIYDLSGNKVNVPKELGLFENTKGDYKLRGIVGNKMFVINYKDKILTIYEVNLKD
jgi:hypothetical protein